MALKKIKPLSPDIYLGHTIGDNEVARLGHVNDIVSKFRKTHEFPVPTHNSTVRIVPNHVETIVTFKGTLTQDFTLQVDIDPYFSMNLEAGDKMYIMLTGAGVKVYFAGSIVPSGGGGILNPYIITDPICIEVIYNGTEFVGIDTY
jgi:hypothetical protein